MESRRCIIYMSSSISGEQYFSQEEALYTSMRLIIWLFDLSRIIIGIDEGCLYLEFDIARERESIGTWVDELC